MDPHSESHKPDHPFTQRIKQYVSYIMQPGRRHWVIAGVVIGLFAAGLVTYAIQAHRGQAIIVETKNNSDLLGLARPEPPVIEKELPLDGVVVTKDKYDEIMRFLPMAVMIENLHTIRPVSGLSRADVVYEALVEAGITRYMAVYHREEVDEIMPVRSARSYYLDWLEPIDATYMHIGGAISDNPRAVAIPRIFDEGIKSYMNIYGSWWRRSDRVAPHNAFTSTKRMKDAQDKVSWNGPPTIQQWRFKDDAPAEERPEAPSTISLQWGTWGHNNYAVTWVYDPVGNRYFYEVGGVRQTDPATGDDVTTRNVIIQLTNQTLAHDQYAHILYDTIGEGRALIFLDGKVIDGIWKKPDLQTRTRYFDSENKEIEFNRGRSWVQVAPTSSQIVY